MRLIKAIIFGLLAIAPGGFGQDLVLRQGEMVVNNDSIFRNGTKSTELIEVGIFVTNNRASAVSLKVRKIEIQPVDGAECSFCWGECYTPAVSVSPMSITIQPGATDRTSFVADYRPFGMEGTCIVRYTFFDPADTTYQQSVTFFFQIGVSGTDPVMAGPAVKVFPNPADQFIRMTFSAKERDEQAVILVNALGQEVASAVIPASASEFTLPANALPEGFYFLRISERGGKPAVYKVMIRR